LTAAVAALQPDSVLIEVEQKIVSAHAAHRFGQPRHHVRDPGPPVRADVTPVMARCCEPGCRHRVLLSPA
jgi:hypothetical protein